MHHLHRSISFVKLKLKCWQNDESDFKRASCRRCCSSWRLCHSNFALMLTDLFTVIAGLTQMQLIKLTMCNVTYMCHLLTNSNAEDVLACS